MDSELRELVNRIYSEILQVANRVCRNCKHFNIEILQIENPSYSEIAKQMWEVSAIISSISSNFPDDAEAFRVECKAKEYAQNISDIGKSIENGDEEALKLFVSALDKRPFI